MDLDESGNAIHDTNPGLYLFWFMNLKRVLDVIREAKLFLKKLKAAPDV